MAECTTAARISQHGHSTTYSFKLNILNLKPSISELPRDLIARLTGMACARHGQPKTRHGWAARVWVGVLFAAVLLCPLHTSAQTDSEDTQTEPLFIPPKAGTPSDRLGAGTRDVETETNDALYLLIPPDGGYTTLARPPLIWHVVNGFRGTVAAQIAPVSGPGAGVTWEGAYPPGYYALDLSRSELVLELDTVYEVQVTLMAQGQTVARATGLVERVAPTEGDPGQNGIWFDTLAPLVTVDVSGRVRVTDREKLAILLQAGEVSQ